MTKNILELIGNTPIIKLDRINSIKVSILAKLDRIMGGDNNL